MRKHLLSVRGVSHAGVTAAAYVVITMIFLPLSFRDIQFRFAEALNLLAFFNPVYAVGVTLGCLFSNMFLSEFGLPDIIIGTVSTGLASFLITKTKHLLTASLIPVFCTLPVSIMISVIAKLPLPLVILTVAVGEFAVMVLFAYPLFKYVFIGNKAFNSLIITGKDEHYGNA